jgi:hypothetical protein
MGNPGEGPCVFQISSPYPIHCPLSQKPCLRFARRHTARLAIARPWDESKAVAGTDRSSCPCAWQCGLSPNAYPSWNGTSQQQAVRPEGNDPHRFQRDGSPIPDEASTLRHGFRGRAMKWARSPPHTEDHRAAGPRARASEVSLRIGPIPRKVVHCKPGQDDGVDARSEFVS